MTPNADAVVCPHRRGGRCLWPEHYNPGLHTEFHCARIDALTEDFDAFLDRAEAFGLSDAQAERLYGARRERLLPRSACPLQAHAETTAAAVGAMAGCDRFLQGLCLERLPRCISPCPYDREVGAADRSR